MKRSTLLITMLALTAVTSCITPFNTVNCSDETVLFASTPTGTFSTLAFEQQCEATITQSDSFRLTVEINENIRDHLDIERHGQNVRFSLRHNSTYHNLTFKVHVEMPELSAVEASGASRVDFSGFTSDDDFTIELSGASRCDGEIRCGDAVISSSGASKTNMSIDCNRFTISLSGASTLECTGNSGNIDCEASGASKLNMKNLQCNNALIDLSGASTMSVHPTGTIRGELSGASKLSYYGSPTVGRFDVSGASEVRSGN